MANHVTLEGWLHWQLVNPDGSVAQEGEQHNLLLNQGLELVATHGFLALPEYAFVGTGSTEPAVTQTTMVSFLQATAANGGTSDVTDLISTGVYRRSFQREFTETQANGNLTEWGFGPNSSQIAVRELFRDGNGNAIVVTKTNVQKLRLLYKFEMRVGPIAATNGSVTITNLGVRTGKYQTNRNDQANQDLMVANEMARGAVPNYGGGASNLAMYLGSTTGSLLADVYTGVTVPAYVPGSYRREGYTYTFNTTEGNGTIKQVGITKSTWFGNRGLGYIWTFDAGQEIVKTNLDKLILTGPAVSWGRA